MKVEVTYWENQQEKQLVLTVAMVLDNGWLDTNYTESHLSAILFPDKTGEVVREGEGGVDELVAECTWRLEA